LPLAHRVHLADGEAGALFLPGHREPELSQGDPRTEEHVLQHGYLTEELRVLGFGAETHDAFHTGPVVPGAVEEDDLTGSREMLDIPLEVPGRGLTWGWLLQRDGAGTTGVEVLIEALDGEIGRAHV